MKANRPRTPKTVWNADQDAAARAQLVRAFNELTSVHNFPVVAAARWLRVSPSVLSGKDSLPFRYGQGGIAALRLSRRPSRYTHVAKLTEALKAGEVLVYDGRVIGGGLP